MCHKRATKWFWSSWGCVQVLIMTLAILLFSPVSAYTMDSGIDLLSELNLYSNYSSYHGVSLTQGYHNGSMAFRLQTNERKLLIPASGYYRIAELIRNSAEFTLTAILKQERGNTGSIIAFSYGLNRYLELESSGKRDEIRFHYTYQTSNGQLQVHTEAFSYQLADENWHKVALSVSGPEIQLLIDCHPLYKRVNHFLPDRNFSASNMQLYIGQRNSNNHSVFKGYIQSAHVIARPHGYLSQCPHMHEQCPTCAQFSLLQRTIDELQKNLINLTQRLVAAESRVSRLEECECKISCKINGTTKADGVEWRDGCNICRCERGSIICEPQRCDPTSCKNPVYEDGACCPKCLKKCYLRKKEYEHGEIHIEGCRNCSCQDGSMRCEKMNCPKLNCSSGEIILAKDECCEVCKGDDYCSKGHACHTNATCLNLYTKYTCTCRQGFQGDGFQCSDIDECAQQGGLNGNHCHYNTRCVNTPGSYKCECLPGFRRLDKFNCVEIDECASGQHSCHENANCINTQGSYHCECKDGYTGNGYDCKPICNQTCLHGGQCSAPNVCTCRMGFIGLSCEQDLDECTTGLHSCKESSECVNMPGWYYCKCKSGYHTLGPECIDIDECSHHTHTCHPTAQCINTEGHFECHCPKHSNANECKMSCMFEDIEVPEGSTISPRNQPCKTCVCNKGVITCAEPKCNCSNWKPTSGRDLCCPQCDSNESCRHQELDHVVFKSGEQWIYQCQTCECLYGEFDCWKLECPPLTCENPLPLQPGDCCQRCPDDPCNSLAGNITSIATKSASLTSNHNYNSRSNSNGNGNNNDINNKIDTGNLCIYGGHQYASGQIFNDPTNQCTTCGCKVPYCAQLVSNSACCVHRMANCSAVSIILVLIVIMNHIKCPLLSLQVLLRQHYYHRHHHYHQHYHLVHSHQHRYRRRHHHHQQQQHHHQLEFKTTSTITAIIQSYFPQHLHYHHLRHQCRYCRQSLQIQRHLLVIIIIRWMLSAILRRIFLLLAQHRKHQHEHRNHSINSSNIVVSFVRLSTMVVIVVRRMIKNVKDDRTIRSSSSIKFMIKNYQQKKNSNCIIITNHPNISNHHQIQQSLAITTVTGTLIIKSSVRRIENQKNNEILVYTEIYWYLLLLVKLLFVEDNNQNSRIEIINNQ